jgi:hypothetical protein
MAQQEQKQFNAAFSHTERMADFLTAQLPGVDKVRIDRMTAVINDPRFTRTNNMQADVVRPYEVTRWKDQQLQRDSDLVGRAAAT